MVERISFDLIDYMLKENIISSDEEDKYKYALLLVIEKIITITTLLVMSIVLNYFIATIIFLFFFFKLRERTGGFHTDCFMKCYFVTIAVYLIIAKLIFPLVNNTSVMVLLVLSVIVLMLIGTVNHPNWDLSYAEFACSKRKTRFVVRVESMCIFVCTIIGIRKEYIFFMSMAIILCAASVVLAKIFKQEIIEESNNPIR